MYVYTYIYYIYKCICTYVHVYIWYDSYISHAQLFIMAGILRSELDIFTHTLICAFTSTHIYMHTSDMPFIYAYTQLFITAGNLGAESDMFKCSKCKQKRTTFYQKQTRSADEPMTVHIQCVHAPLSIRNRHAPLMILYDSTHIICTHTTFYQKHTCSVDDAIYCYTYNLSTRTVTHIISTRTVTHIISTRTVTHIITTRTVTHIISTCTTVDQKQTCSAHELIWGGYD